MSSINIIFKEKGKKDIILEAKGDMKFSDLIKNYNNKCSLIYKNNKTNKIFTFGSKSISQEENKNLIELGFKPNSIIEIKSKIKHLKKQYKEEQEANEPPQDGPEAYPAED